ncbi:MAG: hypothetical protein LBT14_00330 [Treponema sp.]|jgi:hypothetical protein|nr:hypothetical protein [Treponema sp.]
MMKHRISFVFFAMLAGFLVIFLTVMVALNVPYIVDSRLPWMLKDVVQSSAFLCCTLIVLILAAGGILMGCMVTLISNQAVMNIKKHWSRILEKEVHKVCSPQQERNNEITEMLNAMHVSIARIKEASEKMKAQAKHIAEINKKLMEDTHRIISRSESELLWDGVQFISPISLVKSNTLIFPERFVGTTKRCRQGEKTNPPKLLLLPPARDTSDGTTET